MTLYYHASMEVSQNNKIRLHLAELIEKACDEQIPLQEIYSQIASPPQFTMGHFAFACLPWQKKQQTKPNQIATSLADKIRKKTIRQWKTYKYMALTLISH